MHREEFEHGIELFNGRGFFEAHEIWEDVWRPTRGPQRQFLQGLVQMAVALHHHSRGNEAGSRSVMRRSLRNLAPYPAEYLGVDLGGLRDQARLWLEALERGEAAEPPRVHRVRC